MTESVAEPVSHTPGPWVLFRRWDQLWIAANNAWAICRIESWKPDIDEADANLIAAAPTILAALKSCDCPGGGWNGQPIDTIPTVEDCVAYGHCGCTLGDAVKKAEGRDV